MKAFSADVGSHCIRLHEEKEEEDKRKAHTASTSSNFISSLGEFAKITVVCMTLGTQRHPPISEIHLRSTISGLTPPAVPTTRIYNIRKSFRHVCDTSSGRSAHRNRSNPEGSRSDSRATFLLVRGLEQRIKIQSNLFPSLLLLHLLLRIRRRVPARPAIFLDHKSKPGLRRILPPR